jgi:hypothetical protein
MRNQIFMYRLDKIYVFIFAAPQLKILRVYICGNKIFICRYKKVDMINYENPLLFSKYQHNLVFILNIFFILYAKHH